MTKEPQADEPRAEDIGEAGPAAAGPAGPDASSDEVTAEHGPEADQETTPDDDEAIIVIDEDGRVDLEGTSKSAAPDAKPATPAAASTASGKANAEIGQLRSGLEELTRDLQRVTAEYANYRKRVDRDRTLVAEQATGTVLTQLLPVLDDLDRARNHGDLVGPFAAVAEQLNAALGKFGLTAFGDVGDPFDPTLHEAVAHTSSPDVSETACVEIMRRGYLLGDRLLRPALVAVADPE